MGIEPFLVASSVEAVMAQRLVRTICPHCKTEQKVERDYLRKHRFSGGGHRHGEILARRRLRGMPPVGLPGPQGHLRIALRQRGHPSADHEPRVRLGHRPEGDGRRDAHACATTAGTRSKAAKPPSRKCCASRRWRNTSNRWPAANTPSSSRANEKFSHIADCGLWIVFARPPWFSIRNLKSEIRN